MNPSNTFTEKEFQEEIHRFRQECGLKTFWAKTEEQRQAMISGLTFMYLNLVTDDGKLPGKDKIDLWGQWFSDALDNYNRRQAILTMLPLKRALGLTR
jgi:hypothetical protein